ncbi:MAG: hypothetical protein P1U56_17150 [Saprospiraceae bacterium]|nr:hypothetical protein [Saprospiraceae bacterium]
MIRPELKSKPSEDISILVKLDNHAWNYLCECGDASALTVKEIQNSKAVFISHTHIDHFVNFDAVIRHQIGMERRVVICGPKGIADQVQSKIKSYTWNLIEKGSIIFELREYEHEEIKVYEIEPPNWELKKLPSLTGNRLYEDKDFVVTATLLDHKIPVLAYLFKEHDTVKIDIGKSGFQGGKWVKDLKVAFENESPDAPIQIQDKTYVAKDLYHLLSIKKGDSLGIIMDHAAHTENHTKIKKHFTGCNTVFVESFYLNEDREQAETNFHSYAKQSGKIMAEAKVKNPIPVHFSRKYKEEDINTILHQFTTAYNEHLEE